MVQSQEIKQRLRSHKYRMQQTQVIMFLYCWKENWVPSDSSIGYHVGIKIGPTKVINVTFYSSKFLSICLFISENKTPP